MRTSSASPSESFILLGVGVFLCPFISAPFFGLTHSLLDMMIWRVQGNLCCGELSTNFLFDCSSFKQLTCVTSKTSNNLLQAIELISFLAFSQPLNKIILWCVEISVHRQQPKMLRRLDENWETRWERLVDLPSVCSHALVAGDQEGLHGNPQSGDHEGGQQGLLVCPLLRKHLLVQGWRGQHNYVLLDDL